MRGKSFLGLSAAGFHTVAYTEWGPPDATRPVVCVHGLTRNGRDFDPLAATLAGTGRRVACPDVVGRGRSGWLADPMLYGFPQYMADMVALLARLDTADVDWVGTSMGGLIGMFLAARPGSPVRRLVLNDVGPLVPKAALEVIAAYVGQAPAFPDLKAAEGHLRAVHAGFGPLTDAQWRHMAEHGTIRNADGSYRLAYDPAIAEPMRAQPASDVDLWAVWDLIRCPVLVIRGAGSGLLLPETMAEMSRRGPKAQIIEVPGCGHAPSLMAEDQITPIRDFLNGA